MTVPPKAFDPAAVEARILRMWEEGGYFGAAAADVEAGGDPYVIVIPPPNVTSVLHMGHGLNNTIQDVLVRWRRMQGRVALWVPGTDHAGIATQNVVERRLADEGKTRHDLGREAFLRRVWEHVDQTGDRILGQLRAIGCSCDWTRARFTLDEGLSRAVREIFVRLYEDDLVYRGEYIVNWCPRCLTALSNEEAEGSEAEGSLWHIRYPLVAGNEEGAAAARAAGAEAVGRLPDGRWHLTVSTTRPETMLGDTGVAVNPGDPRYGFLVGAEAELPLAGRSVPVVADRHVSAEFGTGMVKVTPAHDPNDFEIAGRAGLEVLNVMTERAAMNENAPAAFRDLDRFEARRAVVAALEREGLLAGRDNHLHAVPRCYRCDTVVEPRLSEQWFVRMKPLAEPALEAARDGTVAFAPDRWTRVYERWMENIRDWCISRQLWWGHRIPVWYCGECEAETACREDPSACGSCGSAAIERDADVLDTWFSSWLWPFSVFGWPEETDDLKAFYPGHALSTAPEILFFWVARMIMAGYRAMGDAPFARVYLHGTVRDIRGRKMSKSLGNGVDPLEAVERFGADALRFTLLAGAGVGADIRLDHEDLESAFAPGRNFVNKLWNAGRFALMSLGDEPIRPLAEVRDGLELEDRWILSRQQRAIRRVDEELEAFRMQGAAEVLRDFFRGDFTDWYLESVKDRLRPGGPGREAARSVLVHVLDSICRLLHPLVPFVTEELWSLLPSAGGRTGPVVVARWPAADPALDDPRAEESFDRLRELVSRVRAMRKEYGVGEGREVALHVTGGGGGIPLEGRGRTLRRLARIGSVRTAAPPAGAAGAGAVLRDGTELFIPLAGVIDLDRERARAEREIGRISGLLEGVEAKLANRNFVTRAPGAVVERERAKRDSCQLQLTKWNEKLTSLCGEGR
ncbi:MAG: valine--tRNA ligase [Gemmatimonadota bacterium]|nr:valine--tRNA ligase [Gemmatimonadota bacterium]